MAHIANCIHPGAAAEADRLSISNYIVQRLSPLPSVTELQTEQPASTPWVWRMAQPDARKYQLFPREKQATASPVKGLAPDQAFALAMGQNPENADKFASGSLRLRIKEHNLPSRRRKVSVPELGPMTTVHESSMDSPTIPGRPAFHERSASAPGNSWKIQQLSFQNSAANNEPNVSPGSRPPVSPKDLPPLMIPGQMPAASSLKRQLSLSRLRSGSSSNESISTRSARPEDSPRSKTPYTPLSATTPSSASTSYTANTTSTLPTPVSAIHESRGSPRSWKVDNTTPTIETPKELAVDASNNASTPGSTIELRCGSSLTSHKRTVSDSSSIAGSIMDRGRPKKKSESGLKRTGSTKCKSAERRAFETLPKGWKATDAVQMLDTPETIALSKQAMQQAGRFEVLRKADVDSLSRELRNLDERCEYLRRTYHSLRAGRRNLHSRICQYLRSPRMIKFSQESLLKQEEALAELDASIDDWVNKLEQAENRRTRVRQKLLEHVAAAVTLPVPGAVAGTSNALQMALEISSPTAPTCPSTPPRSPTKGAFAPQAGSSSPTPSRVVAQVPSTIIEQPSVEDAAAVGLGIDQVAANEPMTAGIRRADVESIRIYAGDEVAALLADVESQITRMSKASEQHAASRLDKESLREKNNPKLSDEERKELHRAQSHEALQGGLKSVPSVSSLKTVVNASSTASTPPPTISPAKPDTPPANEPQQDDHSNFILSSAVFKPQTAAVH